MPEDNIVNPILNTSAKLSFTLKGYCPVRKISSLSYSGALYNKYLPRYTLALLFCKYV